MCQQNPMFNQAVKMAQGKDKNELMQTAQNLCNQQGIDMNSAYNQFMSMFGGK